MLLIIMLDELDMIALFKSLKNNSKLKKLYIAYNDITNDVSDAITTALKNNSCLVALSMWRNPLWTSEAIVSLLNGLKTNNNMDRAGLSILEALGKFDSSGPSRAISVEAIVHLFNNSQTTYKY